jgi:hypothetical protein
MKGLITFKNDVAASERSHRLGLALSVALHAVLIAITFLWLHRAATTQIVAAGPGEGGEGGGGAIEVGVADAAAILGFAKPQAVSLVGDQESAINNARLEKAEPLPDAAGEELTPTEKQPSDKDAIKTDRPVVNQQERIFTGKEERGRSANQTAQVGRSFGSPTPAMVGGVGIGSGGGFGGGTGLPGGSAYGRLIQGILGRNFNPPAIDSEGVQYVIIRLRISRDGRILSIVNGRVAPQFIKQRSTLALVNNAAERAVLAANPLPPFPAGFLTGTQEAEALVWFRYPK